jgi:hypothetical protein
VISLLNHYFIPVYSTNEDVGDGGSAPPEEKSERQRIYNMYLTGKRGVGDVHIYILTPDGQPLDGMSVGEATTNDSNLLSLLNRVVKGLNKPPGEPVIKPTPQSAPPAAPADSLILHLSARGAVRNTNYRYFPAENWIVLKSSEWAGLLPATKEPKVNDSWILNDALASKLLIKFYPQTVEARQIERSRIDQQQLKLTITSVEDGFARARIDGSLRMKHALSPTANDDTFVSAVLVGFVEFDREMHQIQRLRIVTKKAVYGDEDFLAALRSASPNASRAETPAK